MGAGMLRADWGCVLNSEDGGGDAGIGGAGLKGPWRR